ncbi:MAG: dockerin type I repeat-containing protein [Ruminococcus sp.]|nr:dockerin type I repeat-containing protein [Ruminococcus sp.]
MKKLLSFLLTLSVLVGMLAFGCVSTSAAKADIATTDTPQFILTSEPYGEAHPINGFVYGYMGDADEDGVVTVMDATEIQLSCANLSELSETAALLADVDDDQEVTVIDATEIQLFAANMSQNDSITCTLYEDDRLTYSYDQIVDYLVNYGTYDAEEQYYFIGPDSEEVFGPDYMFALAYDTNRKTIDFYAQSSEEDSNTMYMTVMSVSRDNPEFGYAFYVEDNGKTTCDIYGTAELVDLGNSVFSIDYTAFADTTMEEDVFADLAASEFSTAIDAADQLLWEYIDYYVYDIFW